MTKLKFKIVTPERVVYESEAEQVTCRTDMGDITILPHHIPLVATIAPGELKVVENGQPQYLVISSGFLEVRPGNEVVILADAAEYEHEIDLARAEEAREKARKLMAEENRDSEKFAEAQVALELSLAKIKVANTRRKYKNVGQTRKF